MKFNEKYVYLLLAVCLIITLIGFLTGKFLFLFLMIPFGLGLFKKDKP
ncbi:MAG: hypothetical protein KDD41_13465 [Flavobacteriales bacterium]|nr:hypothetical protein [Flavobacteriales bacterium]